MSFLPTLTQVNYKTDLTALKSYKGCNPIILVNYFYLPWRKYYILEHVMPLYDSQNGLYSPVTPTFRGFGHAIAHTVSTANVSRSCVCAVGQATAMTTQSLFY